MRRNSRNGGMAEWRNGGTAELVERLILAEWQDGRNCYLPTSFMVHADDDDDTDTFKSFIVQADRAFGTDSCHDVFFVCFFCLYFAKLVLLFLNHTLLGGMESLRSESGISAFGISI